MSLDAVLAKAAKNIQAGILTEEAQVRQAVIVPILNELGWDSTNPGEFSTEYLVEGGKVDYALSSPEKPLVFVEAKRLGNINQKAEGQLFNYASNKGIPMLVLTDGNIWDFYLSMAAGEPSDRRFYRIEVSVHASSHQTQSKASQVDMFKQFLGRDRVISGESQKLAEQHHNNNQLREKSRKALPEAWENVLNDEDSLLIDILAEEAHSLCGNKPRTEDVREFLQQFKESTESPTHRQQRSPRPSRKPATELQKPATDGQPTSTSIASTSKDKRDLKRSTSANKILGYRLDSQEVQCRSGSATLVAIIKEFQARDPGFLDRLYQDPRSQTRNRRMVSRLREELFAKNFPDSSYKELGEGWWAGVNLSANQIRERIKIICDVAGINYGTQLTLIEQTGE